MSETNSSSDWIYILLTLLTAIFSLVKSLSKKNKENEFKSSSENDTEELQKHIWEEITTEEYADKEKHALSEASEQAHQEAPAHENEETNIEEEFDLKKAIIYNEILNKKFQ
ncbi:MAG: hypothetical protein NC410_00975 [Oscillibacter sp.]|nr:hypothetical protein [Oscillibacter sp.]